MCLLECVEAWDALHIRCRAISHRDACNPLRSNGRLGVACGIEYAAQAMAVHGALLAPADSLCARAGLLVSVRSTRLHVSRLDDIACDLTIETTCISQNENNLLYQFSVSAAGRPLLEGRAAVVLDADLIFPHPVLPPPVVEGGHEAPREFHLKDPMNDSAPPVHAPHIPLTDYYQTEQDRQAYLRQIFDNTAADYDRIEAMLAFGTGPGYRREALLRAGLKVGMKVLDVGVGTGLVAAQACLITGDPALVTGVDPSPGMMAASRLPGSMVLVEGRAESLPFPDNHFDFLSMGYALRHISDLSVAFAEFERVLKPGGRLCILEITQTPSPFGRWLLKSYMRGVIPLLTRFVSRQKDTATIWRYFWDSIEACVPPEQVIHTLNATGLTEVKRHLAVGIFSEYQAIKAGKPE